MSAFGDGRRTAAKGSTGDAEESRGALNARSFQLPKTCSFRLPLTEVAAGIAAERMKAKAKAEHVVSLPDDAFEILHAAAEAHGNEGGRAPAHSPPASSPRMDDDGGAWQGLT